jgi:hypothetical protein
MYKLLQNNPVTGQPTAVQCQTTWKMIPMNSDNTDYQQYLAWLAEGNTPFAADALMPQENGNTFTLSA